MLTAASSASAPFFRAFGKSHRLAPIGALGLLGGRGQGFQPLLALIDGLKIRGKSRHHFRQLIDGRRVFPRRRAQREQPLFDALQFLRVEIGQRQRGLEPGAGLFQPMQRRVERLHRPGDEVGSLAGAALQLAQGRRKDRHRRSRARHRLVRLAQIAGNLFRPHQHGALLGEGLFLARLRSERLQFLDRMAHVIGIAQRTREPLPLGLLVCLRLAPDTP